MDAPAGSEWTEIGAGTDVPDGEVRTFTVEDTRIAVARAAGKLYAVQDRCSHDDGPLGSGELDGFAIQCPRHGARFDIRTGAVLRMPAIEPIAAFPVMEKDERVFVALPVSLAGDDDDDW